MPARLTTSPSCVTSRLFKMRRGSKGAFFFIDCGGGHDLITDEIDCQDLSGWLVPVDAVADFESVWRSEDWDALTSEQDDFMVTAVWSGTPESISVRFEPMP